MRRRIDVETDDVAQLVDEVRIVGQLELRMRCGWSPWPPDALHGTDADARCLGHSRARPMRRFARRLFHGQGDDALRNGGIELRDARWPRLVVQKPFHAFGGAKWALRNIKLRMSRKLLFVSGLFMCISWSLNKIEADEQKFLPQDLVAYLRDWTQRPPLESLAAIVEKYAPSMAAEIFNNYNSFLALLSNENKRASLEKLEPDQAYKDDLFLEADDLLTNSTRL